MATIGRPKLAAKCSQCGEGGKIVLGLCNKHYRRLKRHGDPNKTSKPPKGLSLLERLEWRGWDTVVRVPELGECWEFHGPRDSDGYCHIRYGGQSWKAHRAMYEVEHGSITEGKFILHRCDNPPCINPTHLWEGTHEDNMADMYAKGREYTKVTADRVREIRRVRQESDLTIQEIADMFGIGHHHAVSIIYRRSWKNV